MKAIIYQCCTFESLRALHEKHAAPGVSYSAFYGRYKGGWNLEAALTTPQAPNVRREFLVDGTTYRTIKELANAAGISYESAVKRCHRGCSDHEIFHNRQKAKNAQHLKQVGKPVTVNGVQYGNMRKAYDAINPKAALGTVKARIRCGRTLEEAFEITPFVDERLGDVFMIHGEKLMIKEATKKYGVPESSIRDKLKRGAKPEQAVGLFPIQKGELRKQSTTPMSKRPRKSYIAFNVAYRTIADLAAAHDMDYYLVAMRLRKSWTPERAVTEQATEQVEINGQRFRSAASAWRQIGKTSEAVYNSRRGAGHDLAVCLGLQPLREDRIYELGGITYRNLESVAKAYNIKFSTLQSRLTKMSIEEAVVFVPSNGRYTRKMFRADPSLAATQAYLYFVEIEFDGGTLHKVGITRRTVAARLGSGTYRQIVTVEGALAEVFEIEQAIIKEFAPNRYRADEDFEGRTETFLLTPQEESDLISTILEHVNQSDGCQLVHQRQSK